MAEARLFNWKTLKNKALILLPEEDSLHQHCEEDDTGEAYDEGN